MRLSTCASLIVTLAVTTLVVVRPSAQSHGCGSRLNNTLEKLLQCVTVEGVREHQAALQAVADANDGHRVSGASGYDASVAYARSVFEAAGYVVTEQPFEFQTFYSLTPVLLEQVSPAPARPIPTLILTYSGSGDVTAPVSTPVGISGCSAADFNGFPAGHIALLARASCFFSVKATNAYNAGAAGVIIYNNTPGMLNGTLGTTFTLDIPVTGISQADGETLAATPGLVMRLRTNTFRGTATASNLLAESPTGDPNAIVMAGAHLDSVNAGPGINDNGSGTAAILEVAQQIAGVRFTNKVRFALWGAEENGLIGSRYYVGQLPSDERGKIAQYLNFDMIGSPNYGFFVYNGDSFGEGSAEIERVFATYYADLGLPTAEVNIVGSSDHTAFVEAGIPSGGIFSGAGGIKTAAQVALWGGTAGQAFDPCYHQACDTFANVSEHALGINADAVAYAMFHFATNGVVPARGRVPVLPPRAKANKHAPVFK